MWRAAPGSASVPIRLRVDPEAVCDPVVEVEEGHDLCHVVDVPVVTAGFAQPRDIGRLDRGWRAGELLGVGAQNRGAR